MSIEQYFAMCDQMGWEPKEEEIPIDPSTLPIESQQALLLLNYLPDLWEGLKGTWLGKDYSGLLAIMDIYEIEDRKKVFERLKELESVLSKFYLQKQKENSAKNST